MLCLTVWGVGPDATLRHPGLEAHVNVVYNKSSWRAAQRRAQYNADPHEKLKHEPSSYYQPMTC